MTESPPTIAHQRGKRSIVRLLIAIAGLMIFPLGMWSAVRAGGSRLLSVYGLVAKQFEPANSAVDLSPSDPQAHLVRATLLSEKGELGRAIEEYERAVRLRPRHFWLWLKLGSALEESGQRERAFAAYQEAVRLAPSYAEPRWQLGNALFRDNRAEEGFAEMRLAAASDPQLLPIMIDLAWGASGGDVTLVQQLVQPQTAESRLALARLLIKRGQASEAIALAGPLNNLPAADRKALMADLINARRFAAAYRLWSGIDEADLEKVGIAQITDGGFEERINLSEPGFGWQQLTAVEGVGVARDTKEPRTGSSSLLLDFKGNSIPGLSIISQAVLVQPKTRYRLSFAARTRDVVTGGPPLVTVLDAGSVERRVLAQAKTLQQGTSAWQDFTVEFQTPVGTEAVIISIRREGCSSNPCPIFGSVWFDDFHLQPVGN